MTTPWVLNHVKFGDQPWAVQAEAMARSDGRDKFGYYMECGLGKTATALNKWVNSDADIMITICPNSFKKSWAMAPAAWGIPGVKSGYWTGKPDALPSPDAPTRGRVMFAVNYDAAKGAAFDGLVALLKSRRVFLNLDETSVLKHYESGTSRAILDLAKRAHLVTALNGTPYTHSVMDFFVPLKCLGQLNGTNPVAFRKRYAVKGGFMGKQIVGIDPEHEDELWRMVDAHAFRAKKADWRKDLPPRVFTPVHVDMTSRQVKAYREMQEYFFTSIRAADGIGELEVDAQMVATQMGKLRQISGGLMMQDGRFGWIEQGKANPKVAACLDIADNGWGKTIIVYHYKPTGQMIHDTFVREGFHPAWLKGQMKPDDFEAEKSRFNDDAQCRVAVCQQEATCMGHDFIGGPGPDRATKMAFFENSYSLRDRLQMLDRNHRGEADQDCVVYDIIASPSDQYTVDSLELKLGVADRIDAALAALRAPV